MMERVLVIGSGGAGKSSFAAALAGKLGLPLIHLDAEYWSAGWTPTPPEEWAERVRALADRPRWVMDGNYGGTLELRLERCDTVVFLDLPPALCLWRVVKRWLRWAGRTRPDMAPGCRERLSWEFVTWVWRYRATRRDGILRRLAALGEGKRAVVLTSPRAVRRLLDEAAAASA
jgi:adenylate kinase family enzyme